MAFDTKEKQKAAIEALKALKAAFNGKYVLPQEVKDKNDAISDIKKKKIFPKGTIWTNNSNTDELEGKSEEEQEQIKQDQEARKQQLKDLSGKNDDGTVDNDKVKQTLDNFKNDINRRTDMAKEKEKEQEIIEKQKEQIEKNERLARFDCYDFDAYFKNDLENTIKQQIEDWHNTESYELPDEEYIGTRIISPGVWAEQNELDTPVIAMFIDISGSFDQKLRDLSADTIEYILNTYEFKDNNTPPELRSIIYYFGDNLHKTAFNPDTNKLLKPTVSDGSTGAYPKIIEKLKEINATDVLIFTDFDFAGYTQPSSTIEIPGVCWWLFPDSILGSGAKATMDKICQYIKTTDPTNVRRYVIPADKMCKG